MHERDLPNEIGVKFIKIIGQMDSIEETIIALSFFDKYQGEIISKIDAEEIREKQQEIIRRSFSQGFEQIKMVDQTKITGALIQYLYKVDRGVFLNTPDDFQREQEALFYLIHSDNLTDTNKVFYEYLIGLSRFVLSIQLLYGYVKYINNNSISNDITLHSSKVTAHTFSTSRGLTAGSSDSGSIIDPVVKPRDVDVVMESEQLSSKLFFQEKNYSLTTFFHRLLILSDIGEILISDLFDRYFQSNFNPEKYWNDLEQYFHQRQHLDNLAKHIVSIQYVPENKRYLAIMQSIHWQGLGGSGDILLKFDQLKGLIVHSISHHDDYNMSRSFNKRLLVFKLPLETILARTQNLICEYLKYNFPTGAINIHDFCSGPRFTAVKAIIDREKQRQFNLTVSDIDGSSLISLLKEKEQCHYENIDSYEVRYEDLCLPLRLSDDQVDKYHLVTLNLGLHQLPIEEIYAAIRHFSKITKIGALIANLDASERRYLQLMAIPGNVVDREGHVPYIDQMDIARLIVSSQGEGHVKIAYPLVNLSKKVFIELDQNIGAGPYMVAFYTPVIITRQELALLIELWIAKKYDDCDHLVRYPFHSV